MANKIFSHAFSALLALSAITANVHGQTLADLIKDTEIREGCIISLAVTDAGGNTLAEWNADYPMVPASTMKTVTTGLALQELGSGFRFRTSIAYSGYTDSLGTLHGDLYIIGGADPTLASTRKKQDSLFNIWGNAVKSVGIDSIAGSIIGDAGFFPDEMAPGSWEWGDLGTYYGAGASGLSFHENSISIRIIPAEKTGQRPYAEQIYPETPWMHIDNLSTTGPRWSPNTILLYTSELSPVAEIRGSYPINGGINIEECCNKYPAMTCAYHFDRYLAANGINSLSGPMDTGRFTTRDPSEFADRDSLHYIITTYSESLSSIVAKTNMESNNMYAETLFKMTGLQTGGSASYETAIKTAGKLLDEMGIDTKGYRQTDGSGLSRQNLVSARFLSTFLSKAAAGPEGDAFIKSLPVPGHEGTLKHVLKDVKPEYSSRIRAKSGSMSGVRCYAGYIFPDNRKKPVSFALMSNNHAGKGSDMQKAIEEILKALLAELMPGKSIVL